MTLDARVGPAVRRLPHGGFELDERAAPPEEAHGDGEPAPVRADTAHLELALLDDDGLRARVVWARAVARARREPAHESAPLGVADARTPGVGVRRGAQLADGQREQAEHGELELDRR